MIVSFGHQDVEMIVWMRLLGNWDCELHHGVICLDIFGGTQSTHTPRKSFIAL
jgi:hypothetical protein